MTSTLQDHSLTGVIHNVTDQYGVTYHPASIALREAVAAWRQDAADQIVAAGTSLGGSEESIREILRNVGLIDPLPATSGSTNVLSESVTRELDSLSRSYPALTAALRAKLQD